MSYRPALEAIVAQLRGAVYAVEQESARILYVSSEIERLVGISAAKLSSEQRLWTSIVHADDLERVEHQLLRRESDLPAVAEALEYRLRHRDGSVVWIEDRGVVVLERGRCVRQAAVIDISERQAAREAQAQAIARYDSLLGTLDQVLLHLAPDGVISYASASATRLLGADPGQLTGASLLDQVHPADRDRFKISLEQAGEGIESEVRLRMRSGERWGWFTAAVRPAGELDGMGIGIVLRESTTGEQATEELGATERMLRTILDAVDEAFILRTSEGDTFAMNRRARDLLGPLWAAQDRLPPDWKLIDDGGLPIGATVSATRVALETDKPMSGTIGLQRADGEQVWMTVDARPLHRQGHEQPFAAIASFADVTSVKRAHREHASLELEKRRRQEAEDVAHRLRAVFAPARAPVLPGVELASLYVPAADGVSGDWHDVIPLPNGSVGLVIGDVTGHGIQAAALMGMLRSAVRALAVELHSPSGLLARLDTVLNTTPGGTASIAYAIVNPDDRILRFASAGHPPPMLLSSQGLPTFLRAGRSPLVGVAYAETRAEAAVALAPDSTLVLYTDGVLDLGAGSVETALERLAEAAASSNTSDPEPVCTAVMPLSRRETADDDAAVLACRLSGKESPRLRIEVEAEQSQLPVIRRALGKWLSGLSATPEEQLQLLLACDEASRNVVEHAYGLDSGTILGECDRADREVTIRVRDSGSDDPSRRIWEGRGIALMRKLVDRMEMTHLEPGTEIELTRSIGEPAEVSQ
ncbi:MAG: SpoIIE family protein phosphatase [Solirubrobacteraceae bacterium]